VRRIFGLNVQGDNRRLKNTQHEKLLSLYSSPHIKEEMGSAYRTQMKQSVIHAKFQVKKLEGKRPFKIP
jgi:hypothetical protein